MTTETPAESQFGPVQMLVIGFDEPKFTGKILPELRRLKELDVVRLIDVMVVQKDEAGDVTVAQVSDLDESEAERFGAIIGALIGLGTGDEDVALAATIAGAEALADGHVFDEQTSWYLTDAIPAGTAAAVALIEHRWAIPLRELIIEAGGFPLADEWIHPADLVAVGMGVALEAGAAQG